MGKKQMKEELSFIQNGLLMKIISFNRKKMVADLKCYKEDKFIKDSKINFAQLPKRIKIILNPKK